MNIKRLQGKHAKKRVKLPMFVYVAYFLVATLVFTGVTFSGYITVTAAEDTARVARFEISESGLQEHYITASIIPGESAVQELKIQNKSEVAVEYTIKVEKLTDNLPVAFRIGETESEGNVFTYTQTLQPNETAENTYTLELIWPDTPEARDPAYSRQVDLLKVTVSAVQKD